MASADDSNKYEANVAEENCMVDPVQAPEARFECPICLQWLRDPMQTSCGHRFCRNCIQSWLQRETLCPVDNKPLDKERDIFPDNFTRREISQQKVKCPNVIRGCLEELSPFDVELHLYKCQFGLPKLPDNEKLRCKLVDLGCNSKFEDEPEQHLHEEKECSNHIMLLYYAFKKFFTNYTSASTSALAQQANFWDPPSKSDRPSGIQIIANSDESTQNLIKSLYEKIVILEQKTREQDIIIANMSQQIAANNLAISQLPLQNCNGCFLWYITDFRSKINQMKMNPHIVHYSSGFYTSPNGYKLCIRLNLSPKDSSFIAILIHMMKTNHDNSLEWPFSGRISVTLVHPTESFHNIKETMMTRPELEAFKRPIQDINPRGFGYTEYTLIEDLYTQEFLDNKKNNQLVIKVTVQPV